MCIGVICMADIHVRHVGDEFYRTLKSRAASEGKSVKTWIIEGLEKALGFPNQVQERTYDQGDTQPVAFMPRLELGEPLPLLGHDRDQHEDGTCRIYGCLRCRAIKSAREKGKL